MGTHTGNDDAEKKEESDEEIDFGYWESATLDEKPSSSASKSSLTETSTAQDVNLL